MAIGQRAADGPANLVALLRRCERVGYTAWHRLHTYDRRSCQLQLWNVVEDALRLLDAHPAGADAQAAKRALDDAVDPAREARQTRPRTSCCAAPRAGRRRAI